MHNKKLIMYLYLLIVLVKAIKFIGGGIKTCLKKLTLTLAWKLEVYYIL